MKNTRNKISRSERGQAIIIIVFAIIGLIAMTALVIDGSLAFSNRRHAQNAADTASLAAARAKVRDEPWKPAALTIASENDFTDLFADDQSTDPLANVEVYGCEESKPAYADCGDYEGNSEYLVVTIISTIDTYFARVIGFNQITNRVKAIAQAKPSYVSPTEFGQAMISLMCGCKDDSGSSHDAFTIGGNSINVVNGSGVFVNSNCEKNGQEAFTQGGSSSLDATGGVCVMGAADYTDVDPPPQTGGACGTPYSCPPPLTFPNVSCDLDGDGIKDPEEYGDVVQTADGYDAYPGYIENFPTNGPSGTVRMNSGVYCLLGDVSLAGGWALTTDLNNSDTHDQYSEGVLIKVEDGKFVMNGGVDLELHAINNPDVSEDLQNLLIYLPPENSNTLTINGNANSTLTGSIWAPSSHCTLSGTSGSVGFNSQVMCFTMATAGSATLDINYNQSENHIIQIPPSIEQTE